MTSSSTAYESICKVDDRTKSIASYDACQLYNRGMCTEDLVNDGVEIGKVMHKLIVCRVCAVLEKLVSQLCLHIRVARKLKQCPLEEW